MSNQNNMMQKMAIQSNVNLSRYKKDIDGTVKINDSNMAVVGNKFNPLTKVDTGMTTPNIMEVKDGLYGYGNRIIGDVCYDKQKELIDFANKKRAIAIIENNDPTKNIIFYIDGEYIKFIKHSEPSIVYNTYISAENKNKFMVRETGIENIYFFVTNNQIGYINISTCNYTNITNSDCLGSVCVDVITNYVSGTNYQKESYTKTVIITEGSNATKFTLLNSDGVLKDFITTKKWFNFGNYCVMLTDGTTATELVYDADTKDFRDVAVNDSTSGNNNRFGSVYGYIKENLTTINILSEKIVDNGWIFSKSVKIGSSDNFKLISSVNFNLWNNFFSGIVAPMTSLENSELVDNNIYIYRCGVGTNEFYTTLQGCNIINGTLFNIGVIDQKYESGIGKGLFRALNGDWFFIGNGFNADCYPPITVGNKIYCEEYIVEPIDSTLYTTTKRMSLSDIYNFINYGAIMGVTFTSDEDWVSRARYWVLGNKSMDNPFIIQMAPILSGNTESLKNFCIDWSRRPNSVASLFYFQNNNTDATLYNYLNEPYTAPTDSDFYIPMAPTDKILGKVFDKVIIQRADGSTAELLRYNNKVYPVYMYSTISENIKYAFVCQGQVYKVANNIIYDSLGNGVCDVSDMEYIGGNGIVALFYNNRSKSIYQFSASNGIEVLFSSDDIKEIILTDISNTNDEVYIYCRNFDNKTKLICIESDGQIYTVTDSEITKFQIGKNGVYTWENGHVYEYKLLTFDNATGNTRNNYIETNYYGTDEFKLANIDRIYLRFCKVSGADIVNNAIVTLSMITVDGKEINEQYNIMLDGEGIHRIAPKQKNCIGLKVRIDGINDYTLTALSVGVTNDCNVIVDNTVINNNLDASIFE